MAWSDSSPYTLKLSGEPPPRSCAEPAPLLLARVARVRLKRRLGKLPCAALMRWTRAPMTADDCPASMSKSTPRSPDEAQRWMKVVIPASDPQVKEPAAPPVE